MANRGTRFSARLQNCERRLLDSSCLYVRPPVRSSVRSNLAPTWRIFMKFIFRKSVQKIQFSLQSDKNNGYFTWRQMYIFDHISLILLNVRNISCKICRENQNTHFTFSNFFSENRVVQEIMWKNMVQPRRLKMTIQYGACALRAGQTKLQTRMYSEYVTLMACLRQQCLFEHASHSVTLHALSLSCFKIF